MNKYIFRLLTFIIFINIITTADLTLTSAHVFAESVEYATDSAIVCDSDNLPTSDIVPNSSDIEWRYKYIDGTLYKRKYNKTTHTWIGSWIKA